MASGCLSGGAVVEIKTKQQARAASFHLANRTANRTASYFRSSIAERILWNNFRNGLNPVFGPARSASPCCSTSTECGTHAPQIAARNRIFYKE